jgi:hypothetical protein
MAHLTKGEAAPAAVADTLQVLKDRRDMMQVPPPSAFTPGVRAPSPPPWIPGLGLQTS